MKDKRRLLDLMDLYGLIVRLSNKGSSYQEYLVPPMLPDKIKGGSETAKWVAFIMVCSTEQSTVWNSKLPKVHLMRQDVKVIVSGHSPDGPLFTISGAIRAALGNNRVALLELLQERLREVTNDLYDMTLKLELIPTGSLLKEVVLVVWDEGVEREATRLPQVVCENLMKAVKRVFTSDLLSEVLALSH
eukprot:765959-Hanusia_phi.AAC.1